MVGKTHTMTLCIYKNKTVGFQEQLFLQTKIDTVFFVIVTKPVCIVFENTIYKIKEGNLKYVTP